MQKTINTQQSMIDLFTALAKFAEQGVDAMDEHSAGSKALIAKMLQSGASMHALIDMHPTQSISLYLTVNDEDRLVFQMTPQINQRIS